MPVRSINLKIVISRNTQGEKSRQSIWTTHAAVNDAVRYYEEQLLIMRGLGYHISDKDVVSKESIQQERLSRIRRAQLENGLPEPLGTDAELNSLVRKFYEFIVPSSVKEDGNAQQANGFLSPLTDPISIGYLSIFEKLGTIPDWVGQLKAGDPQAVENAKKWSATSAGIKRLSETGAPPKWKKLFLTGDPSWPQSFSEDIDKKIKEIEGAPKVICQLMEMGVLPLFPAYFADKLEGSDGSLSRWDRLAFRLAVGHMLSWESWCIKSAEDHFERKRRVESFSEKHTTPSLIICFETLEKYQKERQEKELGQNRSLPMQRPFRITRRQIRGWEDLRDKWLKNTTRTYDSLKSIASKEQTKKGGRFGDPHLFLWLAKPENHAVWDADEDALSIFAKMNAMRGLLERSRETAYMTLPDPIEHPRSIQWEAEGGSNFKNYVITHSPVEGLHVQLPLLCKSESGKLIDQTFEFPLAPSDQFKVAQISKTKSEVTITHQSVLDEEYRSKVGAADLLMDWPYLKNRRFESVEHGDIGPVFLKLSLDIERILPDGWTPKRPQAISHFSSASGNSKHKLSVVSGLRVLSVDLGIRSFGACSVFELSEHKPTSGMSFEIEGLNLWANHERSFMLNLPDEDVGNKGRQLQKTKDAELRAMRRVLGRYRKIYALAGIDPEDRKDILELLCQDQDIFEFERTIYKGLVTSTSVSQPLWEGKIKESLKALRNAFGRKVREWRRANRLNSNLKYAGKTMWAIQHLEDTRRFLHSWSHLGRFSGEIRRADRVKRGVFATRLLQHLDSVKRDRLKTGADLLVQSARGFLRDNQGNWKKSYAPCQVILFEDLSRYLMQTDRPRRENSQLMKWSHRSIPLEVAMQGELYGIHVCDTSAAFSSRYHARLATPGIRCHALRKEDLSNQFLIESLQKENPDIDFGICKAGDLIPRGGGEIFVSCDGNGGISRIHADINAAQNLQRRFWLRHGEAIRIPARKITLKGDEIWVPRSIGKRLQGAMSGCGYLIPTGHESGSCRWERITASKWESISRSSVAQKEEVNEDLLDIALLEEEALELSNEYTTFFRDPSGITLPSDLWFPMKTFWGMTRAKIKSAIKQ
ncbi:MAG: hypothetical protein F9K32_00610 [Desulfobulbaceae bacterium]|nr:MAG: hypothetical protein F9K32_00610 [Desulfobulbaceae bacterium]